MSILINEQTRLLVQGITGREGQFHTEQMIRYGTNVVAGVTPGRGGEQILGIPVFNTVKEAVKATEANASIVFVPALAAADAIIEAADAGISLVICVTEWIPFLDILRVVHHIAHLGVRLIGPNCPGITSPGKAKVGIIPGSIHTPGPVGLVSRSGTLTYEVVQGLTDRGLGQSTCIGIGGDPTPGTSFVDALELFEKDPETEVVVLMGEIGGSDEEDAAAYIANHMSKPVVAYVAGVTAPPGKRMGHAGAIISGGTGAAADKVAALRKVGVKVAQSPADIPGLVALELGWG